MNRCVYDWALPGEKLVCVAGHRHGSNTTVILRDEDTLGDMQRLNLLTGRARADALAACRRVAGGQKSHDTRKVETTPWRYLAQCATGIPQNIQKAKARDAAR